MIANLDEHRIDEPPPPAPEPPPPPAPEEWHGLKMGDLREIHDILYVYLRMATAMRLSGDISQHMRKVGNLRDAIRAHLPEITEAG